MKILVSCSSTIKYQVYRDAISCQKLNTNPFHSLQVSLQQTVQGEGDDVVHILQLQTGSRVRAETCAAHPPESNGVIHAFGLAAEPAPTLTRFLKSADSSLVKTANLRKADPTSASSLQTQLSPNFSID